MPSSAKSSAKHEYDKPRLKRDIDRAMDDFLNSGRHVERVPSVLIREPPAVQREEDQDKAAKRH
ncbi:MAG: hypothetical protein EOO40_06750 [Deltaproteobacteria bacterium]|nr:MAG: hypothetical protein EOO40_06750 [Deltaproteobacteria bacterium]